jgi:hypothetical protein
MSAIKAAQANPAGMSAAGESCRKAANSRFRIRVKTMEQTSGLGVSPMPDGVHPTHPGI